MENKNNFENEIDFKSLLKSPSRLFGWIFPYYAVLFVIVGIFYVKHMNNASFNTVPPIISDSVHIITAHVDVKKGGIMPAVDLSIILNPPSKIIEKGKTLFATNCSSCHGTEGKGDGLAAAALNPAPRNFHSLEGWTNGRDFNSMYSTLQNGVPGTGMIAYEYLPVEDRISIIQYIRTFGDFPKIDDASVSKLDELYDLSKGVVTPNHITIEMASSKIADDTKKINESVKVFLEKNNLDGKQSSIDLFNKYVSNKERAVSIFFRDFSKTKDVELFINRLISSPESSGFKPNVVELSKQQLIELYNVLVIVSS